MSEERTCKNCKYFEPFAEETPGKGWFKCAYHGGGPFYDLDPCAKHEFAAPPSWEPLDPEDYEPGCTERGFCECNDDGNPLKCVLGEWYKSYNIGIGHVRMCKCVHCYKPKKKVKTQKFVVVKIPYDGGELDISATSYWDKPSQQMQQRKIFIVGGRTERIANGGLSYEIIEEPVK